LATTLTAEERTQRARLAAQVRWSRESPEANVARMRAGMERKFLDEVDPDRVLPEAERLRRAESARRAFYTKLSFASARARRARREGGGGDAAA
jgi:hypothetical protein